MPVAEASVAFATIKDVSITFAEITANSDSAAIDITVYGARVGQTPIVTLRAALEAGITYKQNPFVSAANTVSLYLHNHTGGDVTPAAQTADVIIL